MTGGEQAQVHGRPQTHRRRAGMQQPQRRRLKTAPRCGVETTADLSCLAGDTIRLIEKRISHWDQLGDAERVRRLEAVRRQLILTYGK